jgi:hypothetical protein
MSKNQQQSIKKDDKKENSPKNKENQRKGSKEIDI